MRRTTIFVCSTENTGLPHSQTKRIFLGKGRTVAFLGIGTNPRRCPAAVGCISTDMQLLGFFSACWSGVSAVCSAKWSCVPGLLQRTQGLSFVWPTKRPMLWSGSLPLCHETLHKSSTAPCSKQIFFYPFLTYLSCHFGPLNSTMRGSLGGFYWSLSFITRTPGISPDPPHSQWSTCHPISSFLLLE